VVQYVFANIAATSAAANLREYILTSSMRPHPVSPVGNCLATVIGPVPVYGAVAVSAPVWIPCAYKIRALLLVTYVPQ
jgi:hypothetical protein